MNVQIFSGIVGQDPTIKTLENGKKVAQFSVAVSDNYKNKQDEWIDRTYWHDCVAWEWQAEAAERKLTKGTPVIIMGKSTRRSYDKDGVTKYVSETIVTSIEVQKNSQQKPAEATATSTASDKNKSTESADDDLPF